MPNSLATSRQSLPVKACEFGKISSADFVAPLGFSNPHVQTIAPRYLLNNIVINTANERIATPDGDFLDIAWSLPNDLKKVKAVVVLFHGLEGSIDSHYAKHAVKCLVEQDYICALMHFRGCSHEANITARAYHSGEVEDPIVTLGHVAKRYPGLPIYALGFSLGANMLMNLVAEHADRVKLSTAISISAPLDLAACAKRMEFGFSRVYQAHLLKSMRTNLLNKLVNLIPSEQVILAKMLAGSNYSNTVLAGSSEYKNVVNELTTFYQFDDKVTAPLHGFEGADDYYARCSALHKLSKIEVPTLIVHAADDPFMSDKVIPQASQLSNHVAYELSEHGGHVGFMGGSVIKPKLWLSTRIVEHFNFVHESGGLC